MQNRIINLINVLGMLFIIALHFTPCFSQNEKPEYPYLYINEITASPEHASHLEECYVALRSAATKVNLQTGPGWTCWNDLFDYVMVFPFKKMAEFDEINKFFSQFKGTAGEEDFKKWADNVDAYSASVTREVLVFQPELSYVPKDTNYQINYIHSDQQWVKGEAAAEFMEMFKEFVELLKETAYPYRVNVYVTFFGEDRFHFVIQYDSKEKFYGENWIDEWIKTKGEEEKANEIQNRWLKLITRMEHRDFAYRAEMSYRPKQ